MKIKKIIIAFAITSLAISNVSAMQPKKDTKTKKKKEEPKVVIQPDDNKKQKNVLLQQIKEKLKNTTMQDTEIKHCIDVYLKHKDLKLNDIKKDEIENIVSECKTREKRFSFIPSKPVEQPEQENKPFLQDDQKELDKILGKENRKDKKKELKDNSNSNLSAKEKEEEKTQDTDIVIVIDDNDKVEENKKIQLEGSNQKERMQAPIDLVKNRIRNRIRENLNKEQNPNEPPMYNFGFETDYRIERYVRTLLRRNEINADNITEDAIETIATTFMSRPRSVVNLLTTINGLEQVQVPLSLREYLTRYRYTFDQFLHICIITKLRGIIPTALSIPLIRDAIEYLERHKPGFNLQDYMNQIAQGFDGPALDSANLLINDNKGDIAELLREMHPELAKNQEKAPARITNMTIIENPEDEYEEMKNGSTATLVKKKVKQNPKDKKDPKSKEKKINKNPKPTKLGGSRIPRNQESFIQKMFNFIKTPRGILVSSLTASILFSLFLLYTS